MFEQSDNGSPPEYLEFHRSKIIVIARIHDLVSHHGPDAVEEMLSEFIKSMNRRFQRDALNLLNRDAPFVHKPFPEGAASSFRLYASTFLR